MNNFLRGKKSKKTSYLETAKEYRRKKFPYKANTCDDFGCDDLDEDILEKTMAQTILMNNSYLTKFEGINYLVDRKNYKVYKKSGSYRGEEVTNVRIKDGVYANIITQVEKDKKSKTKEKDRGKYKGFDSVAKLKKPKEPILPWTTVELYESKYTFYGEGE